MAENQDNLRRCPWCWKMIARWATVCEHCQKEVSPLEEAPPDAPAFEPPPAPFQHGKVTARSPSKSQDAIAQPMAEGAVQIFRWVTAVLIFGVLLFGMSLVLPSPSGLVIGALTLGEVAAAYFINRFLWQRLTNHPTTKTVGFVVGGLSVLAIALMVMRQLGIVLRS